MSETRQGTSIGLGTILIFDSLLGAFIFERGMKYMELLTKGADIRYFGKFRAYLFANFALIAVGLLFAIVLSFTEKEVAVGFLMSFFLAGSVLIDVLIWKGVEKKVPLNQRREVFVAFCINGLLVFAKVLLAVLVITIPLALHIGGAFEYKEYTILTGPNKGETVFAKNCGDGEVKDADGKRYKVG